MWETNNGDSFLTGCQWNGKVICGGEIVQDLHSWWFESQCSGGRMRAVGRSWLAVVKDPRYKKNAV
jgi:hypothetical protein